MSGVRFLVLGGDGQLGRELQAAARRPGVDVIALGRGAADITDADEVRRALRHFAPQIVVNAAAYTRVDDAQTQREDAWKINCQGAGVVAAACATVRAPLIHISTDYVFDGAKDAPYTEADAVAPLGTYGLSKAAGEQAVRETWPAHLIVRTSWTYGRHGSNFLKTILRLSLERDVLRVVADQVGSPTASEDLATAILAAGTEVLASHDRWGTYHFAGSSDASRYDFAAKVVDEQARRTGRRPTVTAISTADYPTPARRPLNSRLDSTRFSAAFGRTAKRWQARVPAIVESVLGDMGFCEGARDNA